MKRQHISYLEENLERLIEGTFTNLFGKRLRPSEIALELARALENNTQVSTTHEDQPIAPNEYLIYLNGNIQRKLISKHPGLQITLAQYISDFALGAGYTFIHEVIVKVLVDDTLKPHEIIVKPAHTTSLHRSTAAMKRVILPEQQITPPGAQLMIDLGKIIPLDKPIINIGRNPENQIILDDLAVSRHHVQLRLIDDRYTLFDAQSTTGTRVNGVQVKEHRLQSGDVILIGKTKLLFTVDDQSHDETGQTEAFDPYL
ncbi:MAG: DUF3662 and FHA domain-containing protein [Aggregatilineales bacterium]